MTHVLIVGMTMSGKTTMAKRLCRSYKARGTKTIVLDPLHDPEWSADFATADPQRFMQVVKQSQSCALFVDESGEMIGRYNDQYFWLATRARHYGHKTHFITQRAAQLSPTVRDQCTDLFAFNMSRQDAETLAKEFNKDELKNCNTLPKLTCYHCGRFTELERIDLTTEA